MRYPRALLAVSVLVLGCGSSESSTPVVDASSGCPAAVPRDGDPCSAALLRCTYPKEASYPCGRVFDCSSDGQWHHEDIICDGDSGAPLYCTTKGGTCGDALKGCPAGSHEVKFGAVAFPCFAGDPPDSSTGAPQYVPCCFPGAPDASVDADAPDGTDDAPTDG